MRLLLSECKDNDLLTVSQFSVTVLEAHPAFLIFFFKSSSIAQQFNKGTETLM